MIPLLLLGGLLPATVAGAERPGQPQETPVDVTAERMEYREDGKVLIGIGEVVIRHLGDELKADYVELHTDTLEGHARGGVQILREGTLWTGESLSYNFRTRQGDFGKFQIQRGSFYITAEDSERVGEDEYILHQVMVTTCDRNAKVREFEVRAASARLTDGRYLRVYHVRPHIGYVPFLYLPYMSVDLQADLSRWDVQVGDRGRWGPFVLVGYRMPWSEEISTVTHVDGYAKRGVGLGQELLWDAPRTGRRGRLETYYLRDNRPLRNEWEEERFGEDVDENRYRLRLVHSEGLAPRLGLLADVEYVSDPLVREDFFPREFRLRTQPENRVSLTYRGDRFVAGLLLNKRLNDFYENVDRLPEFSLDHPRQQIADSRFYYEGSNSLSNLYRQYPDRDERLEYDTLRLDSYHRVFYPGKYFGFLNVIPHAGVRATHYGELRPATETETREVVIVTEEGETVVEEEQIVTTIDRGADTRTFIELGLEASYKAFKRIHDQHTAFGEGLRHVTEPYAAYQFRSDPSLEPSELHQFDRIDAIDRLNQIRFGNRNKLQSRRRERVVDLVDVDLFSVYRLDPDPEQKALGPVGMQNRFYPADWFRADMDAQYDTQTSQLSQFNTHMNVDAGADTRISLGYGYRELEGRGKNLLFSDITFNPTPRWGFSLYGRYDFERSELEEHYYVVQHKMDCTGWELGVRALQGRPGEEDETQVWARMWLLAFPQAQLKMFDIRSL